ncbi:helix-turn-helix domain-containing protein [Hathewaya limosa]|uniref:Transcriptional regulator with XRE-family HTH domain n=1 Tax=Hathewaya limosa TaxID=1536 RepID=A0ABU0JU45_HATLI|nr:helix-turn-helix transcriptional regulator [Hathewaya limosa]AWZ48304.1 XRE family transcriptional regulator [Clostridiaceae bacterium 14S0207]MDQ0479741.1 transcriptional regulator with XRE-family HTH domain [Hathewaya limosa]
MNDLNFIGNRISKLRKKLNLTMRQFSELTGCSQGYISDIEHSKNIPSIPKLIEICQVLNITLSEFFNDGTEPLALTPELKELVNQARNLNPEQLKSLSNFIGTLK